MRATRNVSYVGVLALLAADPQLPLAQDFAYSAPFCQAGQNTAGIAVGDLDADGDLDVVFGNGRHVAQADWVFYNNGRGDFYGGRALENEPDRSYGVALGDLDGDSMPDIVVANDVGNRSALYRNDGKGNFVFLRGLGSGREARRAVAIADLDHDGDLDVVLVGPGQDHLYLNEGSNRWTEQPLGAADDWTLSVAVADLDGDGDADIALGNRFQRNMIYLNDGRARFAESRVFGVDGEETVSIAVGDVDRDGDLDIVAGNWRHHNAVYINNGRGDLAERRIFGTGTQQTWTLVLGDMDLDGDLDVLLGVRGVNTTQIDSDRDGRPDRWVNANGNEPSRIYLNDGAGRLSPSSAVGTGNDMTRPIALGDLDGDGDLDIVMGNECQPSAVYFNSLRGR